MNEEQKATIGAIRALVATMPADSPFWTPVERALVKGVRLLLKVIEAQEAEIARLQEDNKARQPVSMELGIFSPGLRQTCLKCQKQVTVYWINGNAFCNNCGTKTYPIAGIE